ncbi:MAG: DUF3795 domain-containing protein [Candidatus Hermodarchaeota archaeon]
MVNVKKELLAPCGLYCGICGVHIAYKDNDSKLKQELLPRFKVWGANTVEDIACEGCLSEGAVFPFCQTCTIKDCVKRKNLEGCRQCDEFPCEIIENWPSQGGKEVMLKEIPAWRELETEKWVVKLEKEHQCPECGNLLYRGATKCYKCQASLNLK